ncbi:MAG: GNAT family N-acetyltransferase [Candidatus Berkelbacteria bacterium]|nr:GNAT family N-acetyltransferase [Candidatus Berkelbacteria bacterium]
MNNELIGKCFEEGVKRYPFWVDKKSELKKLLKKLQKEIQELEDVARHEAVLTEKKAREIKAIWCISGSGSYEKPLLDVKSDQRLKDFPWAHGTDKKRLDYSARLIRELKNKGGHPVLIYNGVKEQNTVLRKIAQKRLGLRGNELFISAGEIIKTIDQVSSLKFPKNLKLKNGDIIGIVSHSAHLSRVMRMVNKLRPFPESVKIVLFPLVFESSRNEDKFAFNEIMGILGYLSRREISEKPYPYKLLKSVQKEEIQIRPIIKTDLMDVFNLSNQDDVRAVSFNSKKIKLADHKKWFARKIKDENSIMLKAQIGGKFAGQIRLDIEEKKALLSVSVDSKYRGRGIASKLIQAAIRETKKRNVKIIEACIKPENIPSIDLFEKNNFISDGKVKVSGFWAMKYLYQL